MTYCASSSMRPDGFVDDVALGSLAFCNPTKPRKWHLCYYHWLGSVLSSLGARVALVVPWQMHLLTWAPTCVVRSAS